VDTKYPGLIRHEPGPFPALLYSDEPLFGRSVTVTLSASDGHEIGAATVLYVDSSLVGIELPIGGVAEGDYYATYTQPDGNGNLVSQMLPAPFHVIRPFCFSPHFEERKVSLQWGQWNASDSIGVRSDEFYRKIELLPGFNGYKIWRGTSPDTSRMQLLRSMTDSLYDQTNRVFLPDTIGWSWRGNERAFADPDSFFFRRVREKVYTNIDERLGPTDSVWQFVRQPEVERFRASPHNGVHYYYAITAQDTSGIDLTLKIDNLTDIVPQGPPRRTLSQVTVVPNPYYGRDYGTGSTQVHRAFWDRTADEHKIQFSHLPEQATIRIYTASGDLVREIVKTRTDIDAADWDVRNANGRLVDAGVYLYRVENPKGGETVQGHFVILP
jgi:hypothetical protein